MERPFKRCANRLLGRLRHVRLHQLGGRFSQNTSGLTGAIPLDDAALGIRGVAGNARDGERLGIRPGTVSARIVDECRMVRDRRIERRAVRHLTERRCIPLTANDPLPCLCSGRAVLQALLRLGEGRALRDFTLAFGHARKQRMHVHIEQTGQHRGALECQYFRLRPSQRVDGRSAADRRDDPAANRQGIRPAGRGLDLAAGHDEIRRIEIARRHLCSRRRPPRTCRDGGNHDQLFGDAHATAAL